MDEFGKNMVQTPAPAVKRPGVVWVFGVMNLVFGCYLMVRMGLGWYKIIIGYINKPEEITWSLLIFVVSIGLIIWLIVLGIGLLTMKRWARRGSVLYGWINVVLIVITLVCLIVSMIAEWKDTPRIFMASITINNGLAVIQWIYMVLLLVFMKTAKVKQAFAAAGEYI
jgi:hypothetical protein